LPDRYNREPDITYGRKLPRGGTIVGKLRPRASNLSSTVEVMGMGVGG
jgi:hypothetical protein